MTSLPSLSLSSSPSSLTSHVAAARAVDALGPAVEVHSLARRETVGRGLLSVAKLSAAAVAAAAAAVSAKASAAPGDEPRLPKSAKDQGPQTVAGRDAHDQRPREGHRDQHQQQVEQRRREGRRGAQRVAAQARSGCRRRKEASCAPSSKEPRGDGGLGCAPRRPQGLRQEAPRDSS